MGKTLHLIASRREQRRDIDKAVNVVRPAVEQDHRRAVRRSGFDITHIEHTGVDLPERTERRLRSPFAYKVLRRFGFGPRRPNPAEFSDG